MTIHRPVAGVAAAKPLRPELVAPFDGQPTLPRAVPRRGRPDAGRAVPATASAADRTKRSDLLSLARWETDGGRVEVEAAPAAAFFTSPATSVIDRRSAAAALGRPHAAARRSQSASRPPSWIPALILPTATQCTSDDSY
jgi:hypothetical protein